MNIYPWKFAKKIHYCYFFSFQKKEKISFFARKELKTFRDGRLPRSRYHVSSVLLCNKIPFNAAKIKGAVLCVKIYTWIKQQKMRCKELFVSLHTSKPNKRIFSRGFDSHYMVHLHNIFLTFTWADMLLPLWGIHHGYSVTNRLCWSRLCFPKALQAEEL